jgi:hypothetical protein
LRTYQRQQHVAGPDRGGDPLDEVIAQLDVVDVLEDLALAVVVGEPVEQPAGRVGRILPPVADEDPTLGCSSGLRHGPLPATSWVPPLRQAVYVSGSCEPGVWKHA